MFAAAVILFVGVILMAGLIHSSLRELEGGSGGRGAGNNSWWPI
jgi:hypothetical protein